MTQSNTENRQYKALTPRENQLAKIVVDIAFVLHKSPGSELLESVYEKCFCYELKKRVTAFQRQKQVPIKYDKLLIDDALSIDLLVDDLLIVKLKAQKNYHPVWEAQLSSHLKLTGNGIGYLINFHVPSMEGGFKRLVL